MLSINADTDKVAPDQRKELYGDYETDKLNVVQAKRKKQNCSSSDEDSEELMNSIVEELSNGTVEEN